MHLSRPWIVAILVFITACANVIESAADALPKSGDEHARTEDAVWLIEDHWLHAEVTGDTAFLREFLLANYRSVDADGSIHDRDRIVAGAAKRRGSTKGVEQLRAYQASHPTRKSVELIGDMAIVTFHDTNADEAHDVRSSDILVYREGGWHAVYSQHTNLSK
jgi:hypothetical protein